MGKFVLAYRGGAMAETAEEQEAAMQAWGAWFGSLGDAVLDGGNPFAASTSVGGGAAESGLTGYSILEAGSLEAATEMAGGCPILSSGGSVDVYETIPM